MRYALYVVVFLLPRRLARGHVRSQDIVVIVRESDCRFSFEFRVECVDGGEGVSCTSCSRPDGPSI